MTDKGPMSLRERLSQELQDETPRNVPEGPQYIEYKPKVNSDTETTQFDEFIHVGVQNSRYFINLILGGDYVPKSEYGFSHKLNVVKYLFFKNNQMAQQVAKELKKTKDEDRNELYRQMNRITLISELADCRNRIAVTGYAWGGVLASLSMMLRISIWRKLALGVTLFHISGSYVNYRNIDRVFDKVNPFFLQDLEEYKVKIKQDQTQVGPLKKTKADKMFEDVRYIDQLEDSIEGIPKGGQFTMSIYQIIYGLSQELLQTMHFRIQYYSIYKQ